ncbi:MAG: GntR family transcriptional regulator [Oscillospiraceae bacterium]|nr:GntR family transcriptional regulator [Oscillospiraceae bacterium]
MAWNLSADRPIYLQLMEQLALRIVSGEYRAGERIPSVRELAQDAAVNPNTMQKALAELEAKGLITTQRTAGRSITEDASMIQNVRESLAQSELRTFLLQMRRLGYTKADIGALLEKACNEEEETTCIF